MFETYGTFPSVIPERIGISIDYGTFMGHMGHQTRHLFSTGATRQEPAKPATNREGATNEGAKIGPQRVHGMNISLAKKLQTLSRAKANNILILIILLLLNTLLGGECLAINLPIKGVYNLLTTGWLFQ